MTETTVRNATLEDLAAILRSEQARKIDVVRSADLLQMHEGVLHVLGSDPQIDADGVTETAGRYLPTTIFDEGIADKLRIPLPFLRRLRKDRIGLYDAVINGLLSGDLKPQGCMSLHSVGPRDPRAFMVRCFRADDSDTGVARALLSDQFKTIDHFDVLTATLKGVEQAGAVVKIASCDLTDRRMVVRVIAPDIQSHASSLLAGYRSPFTGQGAEELPIVFAGFEIANSEVGAGAFTLTPRIVFQICDNGAKITKDAMRAVHLGGKLEEGVIDWSQETNEKAIELITAKATDSVKAFLDHDYLEAKIAELTEKGTKEVNPTTVIQNVGKKLSFSEEVIEGVLDHFIRAGQVNAGGVMQAITSYAQTVDDADLAYSLEDRAVEALDLAAA